MLLLLLCAATNDDYVALKALYEATGGSGWMHNQNWNMSTDVCGWNDPGVVDWSGSIPQVTCTEGRVTSLCASICCPRLRPLSLAAQACATLTLAGTCKITA